MLETVKKAQTSRFMKFIVSSTIFCIILENFKLFTIMGAAFKPIHIFIIAAIIYNILFAKFYIKDIICGLLFLVIPVLPLYRINDLDEWFKSYFIYVLIVGFMMTSMRSFVRAFKQDHAKYIRLFLYVVAFTQILGIIQFVCMNVFDYFFLENFWGRFQFHPSQYGESNGLYRAYSLFLEPSFFAWVCNSALAVILFSNKDGLPKKQKIMFLVITVLSTLLTLSASGLVVMLALLFVYLVIRSTNATKILASAVVALIAITLIAIFTDLLKPLERISQELANEETSGYERWITPLIYIKETLINYPIFGRGLGQEGMVDKIGIIGLYAGINNSLFGIVVWLGTTSLFYLIPAITYSIRQIKKNKLSLILIINLLGIYASTGAWCSVDTFLFLILFVAIGAISKKQTVENKKT